MILINGQVLQLNTTKGGEVNKYSIEYQDGIRDLKTRFPEGVITLKRNGFPRRAPAGKDDMVMLAEEAPPIFMKLTRTVGSDVWAYCKGAPHKDKNTDFLKVPDNDNSEKLDGETLPLDLRAQPDYVFFFWFKSGQIGTNFYVHEPEATRLSELKAEQARKRVSSIILDIDEAKLEMLALAWGLSTYKDSKKKVKKPIEFLRDDLEKLVFKMEAEKQKDKTNLMARGVDEFLSDVKADEVTRPKAILKLAEEEGKLVYDTKNGHWYFDGLDICLVRYDRQDRTQRMEFLAQFLRNSDNADKWLHILKEMVTKEYIDACDKWGMRWLAQQFDVKLNQTQEDLKEELIGKLFPVKVSTEV